MNEAIRELFLTDWVHETTTEEIVKKLVENDERYKEIKRLQQELQRKENIINEIKNELNNPSNFEIYYQRESVQTLMEMGAKYYREYILDKIKELEEK